MATPNPLPESDFHLKVDLLLEEIERQVEASGIDADSEINGGILTLSFADRSKVIVNRQTPNREVWVAARAGGFHFVFDGAAWRDTRSHEALDSLLSRVISQQSEAVMSITL